jgi:hypothetical protein
VAPLPQRREPYPQPQGTPPQQQREYRPPLRQRVQFANEVIHNDENEVMEVRKPALKKFKLIGARRGEEVNCVEGVDKYLVDKNPITLLFWWMLTWILGIACFPFILGGYIIGKILVTPLCWIGRRLTWVGTPQNHKKGQHHHHDDEHGDCAACKLIGNRRRRERSDRYCTHTWRDHKFIHLKKYFVKRPSIMYARERIALHTLRLRQAVIMRSEGARLWKQAVEICMMSTDTTVGHTAPCLVDAEINKYAVEVLVDTGATVSLISERKVNDLKLNKTIKPWQQGPVKTANGNPLDILGVIDITARIGDAEIEYQAIVVVNLSRGLILGKDVLEQIGAIIDLGRHTLTVDGCKPIAFSGRVVESLEVQEVCELYLDGTYTVPAHSEMVVPLMKGGN